jgi:dihydrofolate synthase/folylpolyglutamate synthase
VGLDHQDWLGPDRESIGFEKAGIYRSGRPGFCGDRSPPVSLLKHAASIGAELQLLGRDFDWKTERAGWRFEGGGKGFGVLPPPALPGRIQYDNAATVIAALTALQPLLTVPAEAVAAGLRQVSLPARFQRIPGPVECILDVAHPDAARVLAENLRAAPVPGRSFGVAGMFKDKLAEEVARALAPCLDRWFLGGLAGPRGQSAAALAARIRSVAPTAAIAEHGSVTEAHAAARRAAQPGDRLVVFGSFHTVAEILTLYSPRAA